MSGGCIAGLGRRAEDVAVLAAGQHALGLALHLTDALARDAELVAELRQRRRLPVAEAVALDEHVAMALGQALYGLGEPFQLHLAQDLPGHLGGPLVLHELAYLRGLGVGAHGLVE